MRYIYDHEIGKFKIFFRAEEDFLGEIEVTSKIVKFNTNIFHKGF